MLIFGVVAGGTSLASTSAQAADTIARVEIQVVQNQNEKHPVPDGYVQCVGLSTAQRDPATLVGDMQMVTAPGKAVFTDVPSGLYPLETASVYDKATNSWSCAKTSMSDNLRGYTLNGGQDQWFKYSPTPLALSQADASGVIAVKMIEKSETLQLTKQCEGGGADCGLERLFVGANTSLDQPVDWSAPGWVTTWKTDGAGNSVNSDLPSGATLGVYEYFAPNDNASFVSATGAAGHELHDTVVLTQALIDSITSNPHLRPYDVERLSVLKVGGTLVGGAYVSEYINTVVEYTSTTTFTNKLNPVPTPTDSPTPDPTDTPSDVPTPSDTPAVEPSVVPSESAVTETPEQLPAEKASTPAGSGACANSKAAGADSSCGAASVASLASTGTQATTWAVVGFALVALGFVILARRHKAMR